MKKDAQFLPSQSQSKETMENNLNNKSEDYEEDFYDYDIWFKKHSGLLEEEIKRAEKNFEIYTSICKKYYPFIIRPVNNLGKSLCNKHLKMMNFFCFSCERHFCDGCKNDSGHSLIDLEKLKIKEKDLIKEEKEVKDKISSLFQRFLENKEYEDSYESIKKTKDEILKFNVYVINSYRIEKNNFYKFFNFYYHFRLKEDLKNNYNESIDILKKFFGMYGFKMLIKDLKNHYEKMKILSLIKNLIEFKKYQLKKKIIEKRKKNIILKILMNY